MKIIVEANSLQELKTLISQLMGAEEERRSGEEIKRMHGLSPHVADLLVCRGVKTVRALSSMTDRELLNIPNLGRTKLSEIRAALKMRDEAPQNFQRQDS